MSMAAKRLQKEAVAIAKEPPAYIRAKPLEADLLTFHYVIEGPPDTPYAGGYYHGVLKFPPTYPMAPPAVMMYTPSGRFQPHTRLCLSMSDYHPETWNPSWSVATILTGLLSFMTESADTVGSIKTSEGQKRVLASQSLESNLNNKDFCKLFPELVELAETQRRERAAAARAAPSSSSSAASGAAAAPPSSWLQSLALLVVLAAVVLAWANGRASASQGGAG